MAAMCSEGGLETYGLPSQLQNHCRHMNLEHLSKAVGEQEESDLPLVKLPAPSPVMSIKDTERQSIAAALAATHGERQKAADLLKVSRTTLYRRIKEYGME
jgi:transcriptional regulator of acetoin/glycerol metabolism